MCHVLGLLRLELGRPPVNEGGFNFLWVVDFPLFESLDDDGRPGPGPPSRSPCPTPTTGTCSTPPTRPTCSRSAARPTTSCSTAGSWARAACGSTGPTSSRASSSCSGISAEEAQAKFGFLLDAFRYGAPPHAGFAFGIDRLVALLAGEENIREVIAFPKTQSGTDPLTSAPTPIDPAQLTELGSAPAAQGDLTRSTSRRRPRPARSGRQLDAHRAGGAAGNMGRRPRLALAARRVEHDPQLDAVAAGQQLGRRSAVDRAEARGARARRPGPPPTSRRGGRGGQERHPERVGDRRRAVDTGLRPQGMAMPCTASATVGRAEAGRGRLLRRPEARVVGPRRRRSRPRSLGAGDAARSAGRAPGPVAGTGVGRRRTRRARRSGGRAAHGRDAPASDGPMQADRRCRRRPGSDGGSAWPGRRRAGACGSGCPGCGARRRCPSGTSTTAQIAGQATEAGSTGPWRR